MIWPAKWFAIFYTCLFNIFSLTQVYIGGDVTGKLLLEHSVDVTAADAWIMHPGSTTETSCDSKANALHFSGANISAFIEFRFVFCVFGFDLMFSHVLFLLGDSLYRYAVTSDVYVTA